MAARRCQSCGYDNLPEASFCANCGSNLEAAAKQPLPTVIPSIEPATPQVAVEYMGFWIRFAAAIIDAVVVSLISFVLPRVGGVGVAFPFWGILIPWLYYWLFTGLKGQTLGKMAVGIRVVNAEGSIPGLGIAALREIPGKILSTIAIYLGFLWIIWDGQKQGWHDKIANTYVVRVESRR
jgi:uncharacterized RDD family membrane protein YckC